MRFEFESARQEERLTAMNYDEWSRINVPFEWLPEGKLRQLIKQTTLFRHAGLIHSSSIQAIHFFPVIDQIDWRHSIKLRN